MKRAVPALLLLSTLVLAGCGGGSGDADNEAEPIGRSAQAGTVCAGGSVLEGIDVSYYQGTIDFSQVKASGRAFVIARISDGTGFVDPNFATYYAAIQAAGMVRGSYQFFRPGQDANAQANLVMQSIGALGPGDLAPTLDVEVTDGVAAGAIVS